MYKIKYNNEKQEMALLLWKGYKVVQNKEKLYILNESLAHKVKNIYFSRLPVVRR